MFKTQPPLRSLATLFLRLGLTAFGGPAAHIAMMHGEVVTRRQWLSETEFLDLIAAANLIPGPNSTEVAIHIGYRKAGIRGLLLAGTCFILPAACLCMIIAALYVRFGKLPMSLGILYGVKPVVIAIICQALYRLAKAALKSPLLAAAAVLAAVANYLFEHELLVLFGAATLVLLSRAWNKRAAALASLAALLPRLLRVPSVSAQTTTALAAGTATTSAVTAAATTAAPLLPLFLVFLKIGSVLFGSGYVLLAFLQADLVDRHHWLTQGQLLDSVAVGQFTPGPVFTTATFIGYLLSGPWGALLATVGIFLPAFFFVAITAPFLPTLRKSKLAAAFLDGLNAGSLALMAVVTLHLAAGTHNQPGALTDPLAWLLAAGSLAILLWKNKLNSAWLILAGALIGMAFTAWPSQR